MIELIKTDSNNLGFINLVKQLDAYLKTTDGNEHDFYHQFNNIDVLNHVIIARYNNKTVGCGAFKEFDKDSVEIKRMYTLPEKRGKGVASKILFELELWSKNLGYKNCFLETGKRQVEAVQFYKKNNYKRIPNYGQYIDMENSLCFKKELNK
ncbi:GNAT family N-acetyltransferase [Ichthyenterobacterium magnum]|uniref:Acetyltransferase (GNAT) family protein n=1 Tax=Ichthyenterobacterium magnum TaxID=1230530 RepID=A0A420DH20_9FLAO|nr:GNAT family N-acetyltransferase [Ichthyenterobacterium magnum]RKE92370.1 acetyltransferase (GNAT) family protein [Ichthyenterobacterium magnum]